MEERLSFDKPNRFCKDVFVGNWFEERSSYKKNRFRHVSTYQSDYIPKPFSANNPSIVWDAIFANEGTPLISTKGSAEQPNFFENFSSLYDLSYNHFPRVFAGPLARKFRSRLEIFEPRDEYLNSFGNATSFGLAESLKEKWRCEISDPRMTVSTSYRDEFGSPSKESYKFKRHAIPRPNSSVLYPNNCDNRDVNFRDIPINTVPPNDKLVIIPREPRCNIITWECPFKENQRTRCIPTKRMKNQQSLKLANVM